MPIVLVYLGSRLPLYALLNLRYLRRTFPAHEVWLVSDNPAALLMARTIGVNVFQCSDAETTWARERSRMPYRMDFRKGFWFFSFARFFALAEFMKAKQSEPVLHLEADVWLAPDFPFARLHELGADVAFPMVAPESGVASTLYLSSVTAAETFVDLAMNWNASGHGMTDMGFLSGLRGSSLLRCSILPTAFDAETDFVADTDHELACEMTKDVSRLGGLFDGAAWGIDLLGEEPRNHWGLLRLFRMYAPNVVATTRRDLEYDAQTRRLSVRIGAQTVPLFSLHVHSKDLLLFLAPKWRVAQRVRQRRGGPRSIWLPHVFIRVLWSLGVPWIRRHLPQRSANGRSV